jgi:type I restriction enzyme S subunit
MENQSYKETEIGQIPEDWEVKKAQDCIESIIDYRGKTPKKTVTGIPLITAKVIKGGHIDFSQCEYIADEDYDDWMIRGLPKKGDVVLTTEGPLGEVAQLDDRKIALAQRIVTLRGKRGVLNNNYLKYYLISSRGQHELHSRETGTTVQGIKQSEFKKIDIILPSFSEQTAIAKILSDFDSKIELLQKQNKTLEAIGQAIFKHWFVDFEFPNEEGKPYKSSGGELVFNDELGKEIPKGWEVGNYKEIVSVSTGKGLKRDEFVDNGKYPVLGANGELGRADNHLFNERLILTGRVGTLGTVYLVNDKVWISDNVLISQPLSEENYYFAYFTIKKFNIQSLNRGSTQPLITQTDLKNQDVIIPDSRNLKEFHHIICSLFNKIDSNKLQIQSLQKIRDSLLPKLMSGEIRVLNNQKIKEAV